MAIATGAPSSPPPIECTFRDSASPASHFYGGIGLLPAQLRPQNITAL
ncbi:hypothetical protein ACFQ7F_02425 [Streptomyces sp. NPDC056486]